MPVLNAEAEGLIAANRGPQCAGRNLIQEGP